MKLISYNLNIGTAHYNALSKCQRDGDAIAQKFGYKIYYRNKKVGNRLHQIVVKYLDYLHFLWLMLSADDFLLQYPIYVFQNLAPITKFFMRFAHVTYWVVDINSIRFPEENLKDDIDWIKRVKRLILPSIQMWDFLKEHGLSDNKYEIIIHNLQDYLTDSANTNIHEKNGPICFAGNLGKSQFLQQPIMADIPLSFFLYGAPEKLPSYPNYFYKGKFYPEDISSIEGGWGLVWDGDSCETCSGYLGQYLKYNASHKISLYIVSSIPVII